MSTNCLRMYTIVYVCVHPLQYAYVLCAESMQETVELGVLPKIERNRKLQMHLIRNSKAPICSNDPCLKEFPFQFSLFRQPEV